MDIVLKKELQKLRDNKYIDGTNNREITILIDMYIKKYLNVLVDINNIKGDGLKEKFAGLITKGLLENKLIVKFNEFYDNKQILDEGGIIGDNLKEPFLLSGIEIYKTLEDVIYKKGIISLKKDKYKIHNNLYYLNGGIMKNSENNFSYELDIHYKLFLDILIYEGKRVSHEKIKEYLNNSLGYQISDILTFKGNLIKALIREEILLKGEDIINGKNKGYKLNYID